MKKVTFALILIVGLILLSPPLVGMQARDALQDALQQAADQSGEFLHIRLEDYENGWFEGHGKVRIGFSDSYLDTLFEDDENPELQQRLREGLVQAVRINHGPVIVDDGVHLELGQAIALIDTNSHPDIAKWLEQSGNAYLFKLSMDLGFTGSSDLHLEAPAFTTQMQGGDGATELIFAGAQASGNLDFSDMHLLLDGQMNGFSVRGTDGEAVIERTVLSSDMAYPESDPYGVGEGAITIDRIVAVQNDATAFDLNQARFDFVSTRQDQTLRLQAKYGVGKLVSGGVTYEDVQLNVVADQVSREAMRGLQAVNAEIVSSEDPSAWMAAMRTPVHQMLTAGLTVQIAPLSFIYNDKPFNAQLSLSALPQALPGLDTFQLDDLSMWMSVIRMEADVTLHRELATELLIPQIKQQLLAGVPADTEVDEAQLEDMARAQAPLMLGALIGQGVFRADDNNLSVAAEYSNGAMTVNGNPFPLEAFLNQP